MQNQLTYVAPKELKPPPFNTRTVFDDEKMANLVASVAAGGIHEPIIGRHVNGHIEIVAGERRWRAAKTAKLESVPVLVRELTDAQALEIQLTENEQREDVSALDQAAGFQRLMELDPKTYTAEALAERIGLKPASVYLRLKLLAMIDPAKELFRSGQLDAGHAVLIARLSVADQQRVVDWMAGVRKTAPDRDPISVREIKRWIETNVRIDLFGPQVAQDQPAVAKKLAKLQEKGVEVLQLSRNEWQTKDGVLGYQDYKVSTGKQKCEKAQVGAYVFGDEVELADVCVDKSCKVHYPQEVHRAKEKAKAARVQKESPAAKQKRLAAEAKVKAERELAARLRPLALTSILGGVKAISRPVLEQLVRLALDGSSAYEWEETLKPLGLDGLAIETGARGNLKKATDRQLAQLAVFAVVENRLYRGDLPAVAKEFGVDLKKLAKGLQTAAEPTEAAAAEKKKPAAGKARKKR